MRYSYEQVVRVVCGDDWSSGDKSQDERDGGLGVAMMLAYLSGVPARLSDMSRAIDIPSYMLEMAYRRLQINGLFSPRSWVLSDPLLSYDGDDIKALYDKLYAWCFIAGLSSGFTGKGFTREEYAEMYGQKRPG